MKHFSISEAIQFGWETWKSNALFWIGVLVVVFVIDGLIGGVQAAFDDNRSVAWIVNILGTLVHLFVQIGIIKLALDFVDGRQPQFNDLFSGAPVYLNFFIASIIFYVMFAIGLVLCVVPGIFVAVVFGFYQYAIVDHGDGPIEALQRSLRLTEGVRMDLFLFGLLVLGLNILGALACLVGLFVTVPMSMLAGAYVYRRLDQQTAALQA